jgi:hypothetical protein
MRRAAVPAISFIAAAALEISDFTSPRLAYALVAIACIWGVLALVTWQPVRKHLPLPDLEISVRRRAQAKSWQVELHGVRWETDGTRDKNDRLIVKGPFCPAPCLAPLAYTDALDNWDADPRNYVLGGQYGGELYCPMCHKQHGDLGASKTPDGEVNVSVYRSSAGTHLDTLIRRQNAATTKDSSLRSE